MHERFARVLASYEQERRWVESLIAAAAPYSADENVAATIESWQQHNGAISREMRFLQAMFGAVEEREDIPAARALLTEHRDIDGDGLDSKEALARAVSAHREVQTSQVSQVENAERFLERLVALFGMSAGDAAQRLAELRRIVAAHESALEAEDGE